MILINLLPEELRFKDVKSIHIPYQKIAAAIFFIVLTLSIYNLIVYVRVRSEYADLQKQWNQLADKSAQADALENELGSSIMAEVDFYDDFVEPPLATARILNMISDLIPKSAWLNAINFNRREKELDLTVNGLSQSVAASSKLIEIQNFANLLKVEMEKFLGSDSATVNRAANSHLKVAVTTSSKISDKVDVTQFTASFKRENPVLK